MHLKQLRWNLSAPKSIAAWRESEYLPEQRETIHRNNGVVFSKANDWKQTERQSDLTVNPNLFTFKKKIIIAVFLHNCPVINKKFKISSRIYYRCRQAVYDCRFQATASTYFFCPKPREGADACDKSPAFLDFCTQGGEGEWEAAAAKSETFNFFTGNWELSSKILQFELDFSPCSPQNSLSLNWKWHIEPTTTCHCTMGGKKLFGKHWCE